MTVLAAPALEEANRRLHEASIGRWLRALRATPPTDEMRGHAPSDPAEPLDFGFDQPARSRSASVAPHLLNVHVASTFAVALQAEALAAGTEGLHLAPVDLGEVLDRIVAVLGPLAAAQGVRLFREGPRAISLPQGDARRLHNVLFHLLARALAAEAPGGHARVLTAWSSRDVCVRILTRSPEPLARTSRACRDDLSAARRVLRAMGGALVLEPRRAGYLPLCLVLGSPPSASTLRAA